MQVHLFAVHNLLGVYHILDKHAVSGARNHIAVDLCRLLQRILVLGFGGCATSHRLALVLIYCIRCLARLILDGCQD